MTDRGEEEKHILGIRRTKPEEPRVLGIPRGWIRPTVDFRRIAHPLRWWKWHRQVKRLGAYAPDYDEFDRPS